MSGKLTGRLRRNDSGSARLEGAARLLVLSRGFKLRKILILGLLILLCTGCAGGSLLPATTITPLPGEPPINQPWISPAIVTVSNFYAGATAEWTMRIHNGKPDPTPFSIYYKIPQHSWEDYKMPPIEAKDWVTVVGGGYVTLQPYETREVLIVVTIPGDIKVKLPGKWEFWVGVKEIVPSGGMVEAEMCTRWLINMRG